MFDVMASPMPPFDDATESAQFGLPMYLHERDGVYYFKRKIPTDVPDAFPGVKGTLWQSLRVTRVADALEPLAREVKKFDEKVAFAREVKAGEGATAAHRRPAGAQTTQYLQEAHIPALLARFAFFHLENDDDERKAMTREDRAERLRDFDEGLEWLREAAAAEDYSSMEEVAQELLTLERLIAPPGSDARHHLLRALLAKDLEVLEIQRDRLKGKVAPTPRDMPIAPRDMPTLRTLFDEWCKTQTQHRTINAYEQYVQHFEGKYGALPVEAITTAQARDFRDFLAVEKQLARETVKNRVGGLATLFAYGQRKLIDYIKVNPFYEVHFDQIPKRPASEDRRAYEIHELNQLYQSPLYTQKEMPSGQAAESAYWAPLLGPFLGGRIEEVAQMRVEDIQCVNGAWCFRIANTEHDQHLKTESSYRRVPMHEEVIKCGFLAYAAAQKLAGHTRLFPSQRNDNKHCNWSNALGKWYGRYLRKIGLLDKRLCYHSFRFNFKQRCTLSGVEKEVRDALTGHWISKDEGGLGYMRAEERQYPFPALVKAISALRYDELDLSHLYVDEPMRDVELAFLR